jgi:hypothetical protein
MNRDFKFFNSRHYFNTLTSRVYSDHADRLQYKTIFDELQRVTLALTGQPLRLKRLSKNGTLISIGVDMELAQALGAGDSFLPTNEPEFSNIYVQTAEEIIEYFIRACYMHVKRFANIFKSLFEFWLIIILNAGAYMTSSPMLQMKSMIALSILCTLRQRKKSMNFRHG